MGVKDVVLKALGLTPSDPDEPRGSALAASLLAGAIVAGILWFVTTPSLALFVLALAAIQGIIREILTAQEAKKQRLLDERAEAAKKAKQQARADNPNRKRKKKKR